MSRLAAFAVSCFAAIPAQAATLTVKPHPCPPGADAAPYVAPPDIEADEANPARYYLEDFFVIYDAPLRLDPLLTARIIVQPQSAEADCGTSRF